MKCLCLTKHVLGAGKILKINDIECMEVFSFIDKKGEYIERLTVRFSVNSGEGFEIFNMPIMYCPWCGIQLIDYDEFRDSIVDLNEDLLLK